MAREFYKIIFNQSSAHGYVTPKEHLNNLIAATNNRLTSKHFLANRENEIVALKAFFAQENTDLVIQIERQEDANDFIASFIANESELIDTSLSVYSRCMFVSEIENLRSLLALKNPHVFVIHPDIDMIANGEQLKGIARINGHSLVIATTHRFKSNSSNLITLSYPSRNTIKQSLIQSGFTDSEIERIPTNAKNSLCRLKNYFTGNGYLPTYTNSTTRSLFAKAILIGSWVEANLPDRDIVEKIVGEKYQDWISKVLGLISNVDSPLNNKNGIWCVEPRDETWETLGDLLTDDDIDNFERLAIDVLIERDPKFDLSPDKRYMASIISDKKLQYSQKLRLGIAQSIALLGSRSNDLKNCSNLKAIYAANHIVEQLLETSDWAVWASIDQYLPLLAEASPSKFLDAIEKNLFGKNEDILKKLFIPSNGFIGADHSMSGILRALETLAWSKDYLARVSMILIELATIDPGGNASNRPINSLKTIFCSWLPQTVADVDLRRTIVKLILEKHSITGWKLLKSLLPSSNGISMGSRKPEWRIGLFQNWKEGVTRIEYRNQIESYARMALQYVKNKSDETIELLSFLPNFPIGVAREFLEYLRSEAVKFSSENERYKIWENLTEMANQHKKFQRSNWAMHPDRIDLIEKTATELEPKSLVLKYKKLFIHNEGKLYEEKGDYEIQRKKLEDIKIAAIEDIYRIYGINALIDFSLNVENSYSVGYILAKSICENIESALLPKLLFSDEKFFEFINGYISCKFWDLKWNWVEALNIASWTAEQKKVFFTILPLEKDVWQQAEYYLGKEISKYWKTVKLNPWGTSEELQEAANHFITHKRPEGALKCLNRLLYKKEDFSTDLTIQCLMQCVKIADKIQQHDVLELISWLQKNPQTNKEKLFYVEWNYLAWLDHEFGGVAKTLEERLSNDPQFFCEIINYVYKSEITPQRKVSARDKKIALQAYKLLYAWKTIPGVDENRVFNVDRFDRWINEVKKETRESGHFSVAMSQIGQVLAHSPQDQNGLWIIETIAQALDARDAEQMRHGFTLELTNTRGVFTFTSGVEEKTIADKYTSQAEDLENRGYIRLGTAMRELADYYLKSSMKEAVRNPYDD